MNNGSMLQQKKPSVLLADDHGILREGVKHILNQSGLCEIVGEAADGREALDKIDTLKPDIVILDISMPEVTGIEVARRIRKYYPAMKVIILSRHDNEEYLEQLIKHGIHGYVLKDDAGNDLTRAIEAVQKGETYLSPRITSHLMKDFSGERGKDAEGVASGQFSLITNREREILKLIAEGKSNDEIGDSLRISPRTVKVHRSNLMRKLSVHKVTDLVKYAVRAGLVEP